MCTARPWYCTVITFAAQRVPQRNLRTSPPPPPSPCLVHTDRLTFVLLNGFASAAKFPFGRCVPKPELNVESRHWWRGFWTNHQRGKACWHQG